MKQNNRRKNMKGTPMVTTLSPCLYNKIMNQENKETKSKGGIQKGVTNTAVKDVFLLCP